MCCSLLGRHQIIPKEKVSLIEMRAEGWSFNVLVSENENFRVQSDDTVLKGVLQLVYANSEYFEIKILITALIRKYQ